MAQDPRKSHEEPAARKVWDGIHRCAICSKPLDPEEIKNMQLLYGVYRSGFCKKCEKEMRW